MSEVTEAEVRKGKISILSIVSAVLGALLCVGAKTVFTACEVGEDMIMSCHWAEQMVAALGALIFLEAVAALIFKNKAEFGISIGILLTAILTIITPGILINLCKMSDMHCNMMLRPFAIVMGIVIALIAVINIVRLLRK